MTKETTVLIPKRTSSGEDAWASPWTARRSNQLILKEINLEYSLEGMMLKLKLQYFGHLMWKADSLEKILILGKTKEKRRISGRGWDDYMLSQSVVSDSLQPMDCSPRGSSLRGTFQARILEWVISNSMDVNLSKIREITEERGVRCATVHEVAKSWTWLIYWTATSNSDKVSLCHYSIIYWENARYVQKASFW